MIWVKIRAPQPSAQTLCPISREGMSCNETKYITSFMFHTLRTEALSTEMRCGPNGIMSLTGACKRSVSLPQRI